MAEIQDSHVVISDGARFALLSARDGATYVLRCKEEGSAAHLSGDDAGALLQDYELIKSQYPDYSPDQLLAQLWDQGGYSWMAVPDET